MHYPLTLVLSLVPAAGPAPPPAETREKQEETPQAWDPKTIVRQKIELQRTKWAVREGPRDVPGEAFRYPAFVSTGFHEHDWLVSDAHVVVVQGVLKVNSGENLNLDPPAPDRGGAFLLAPANAKLRMAVALNTMVIGTSLGPWITHRHGDHRQHSLGPERCGSVLNRTATPPETPDAVCPAQARRAPDY